MVHKSVTQSTHGILHHAAQVFGDLDYALVLPAKLHLHLMQNLPSLPLSTSPGQ